MNIGNRERDFCSIKYLGTSELDLERVGLGQAGEKVEERRLFCRPSIDVKSDPTGNLYESCDMEKRRRTIGPERGGQWEKVFLPSPHPMDTLRTMI